MKKQKVLLAMAMSASIAMTALTGCGNGTADSASTEAASEASSEADSSEEAASEESVSEAASAESTEAASTESSAEETETTETEAASTQESEEDGKTAELSDDLYSFQFTMDGDLYSVPMSYGDFTSYGWTLDGDDSESLDARQTYSLFTFKNGDKTVYAELTNFDVNSAPVSKSYITMIQFDDMTIKTDAAEIMLPGQIQYGSSTLDEAAAAYGTATRESKGEYYTTETYEKDIYNTIDLKFDVDKNVLSGVKIENIAEPEDAEYGSVSSDVPAIVSAYKSPSGISDDPADFTISYAGDFYQLPAPLSVFEENGWEITDENKDAAVTGGGFGFITISKDNQNLDAAIKNYSSDATSVHNCFVTQVRSASYDCDVDIEIFNGIKRDMTEADLKTAIGDTTVEVDKGSSYTTYVIEPVSDKLNAYSVTIDGETGKVRSIEVENQPKQAELEKQLGVQ